MISRIKVISGRNNVSVYTIIIKYVHVIKDLNLYTYNQYVKTQDSYLWEKYLVVFKK